MLHQELDDNVKALFISLASMQLSVVGVRQDESRLSHPLLRQHACIYPLLAFVKTNGRLDDHQHQRTRGGN